MYSGFTSGRMLDGELLYTKILNDFLCLLKQHRYVVNVRHFVIYMITDFCYKVLFTVSNIYTMATYFPVVLCYNMSLSQGTHNKNFCIVS